MLEGYSGFLRPGSTGSEYNAQSLLVWSILSTISTSTLVRVEAVTNDGGVAQAGFVDVRPLVAQVDGANNAVPHGAIYRCPYARVQGGANAVILDPQVGDIGIAVFADRDISSATNNLAPSTPGSARMFSKADGLYLFSIRGAAPSQYVQFGADGIKVLSPAKVTVQAGSEVDVIASTKISLTAPASEVNGSLTINGPTSFNGPISQVPGTQSGHGSVALDGPIAVTNDVTAAGKSLSTHTHGGVQNGGGNTGAPN